MIVAGIRLKHFALGIALSEQEIYPNDFQYILLFFSNLSNFIPNPYNCIYAYINNTFGNVLRTKLVSAFNMYILARFSRLNINAINSKNCLKKTGL